MKVPAALARVRSIAMLASLIAVAGCTAPAADQDDADQVAESAFRGTPNPDVGQLFMIEHFGVAAEGHSDVEAMIRDKNLGAIILWNPTNASGETARRMVAKYATAARASGTPELFVAADQEERGTQRFKARHGFTDLVDGASLGRAVARSGDPRACELHARITSREMASAGMNMSLGTVADIYTRSSGTPGMFRTRAISSETSVVESCIRAMTKAYGEEGHVVFVTKHFPGLGNASGNTDVDPSVRTFSETKEQMERELWPYRSATASVNKDGASALFGAMISHASYPILDPSNVPATLSPVILKDVLRGAAGTAQGQGVEGVGFQGLAVSDAFWTWGATRGLSPMEKRRLMARSFLAGMDILMIAKSDFVGAWDYFQSVYAGSLPAAEQAALVRDAHEADWASLVARFKSRVEESTARIAAVKRRVGRSADFVGVGEPRAASRPLVDEYERLTR